MECDNFVKNNADKNSLLCLDDYSLQQIFSHLKVFDQFYIWHLHYRFASIMSHEWHMEIIEISPTDFSSYEKCVAFISAAESYVKGFKIVATQEISLAKLPNCKFPHVQYIEFTTDKLEDCCHDRGPDGCIDENMMKLGEMFPHVKRLILRNCHISKNCINQMNSLEHVSLINCRCSLEDHLVDIFSNMDLEKLDIVEERPNMNSPRIDMNIYKSIGKSCQWLSAFRNGTGMLNMSHLVKFSSVTPLFELPCVLWLAVPKRKRNFVRLTTNSKQVSNLTFIRTIAEIRELQTLILPKCWSKPIRNGLIRILTRSLINLRALHLTYCSFEDQFDVLDFVENCPNLTLLDVTGTNIDLIFIQEAISILTLQGETRTKPLEVWIRDTKVSIDDLEGISHKMLIINTTNTLMEYAENYLEIALGEFRRSSEKNHTTTSTMSRPRTDSKI